MLKSQNDFRFQNNKQFRHQKSTVVRAPLRGFYLFLKFDVTRGWIWFWGHIPREKELIALQKIFILICRTWFWNLYSISGRFGGTNVVVYFAFSKYRKTKRNIVKNLLCRIILVIMIKHSHFYFNNIMYNSCFRIKCIYLLYNS